MPNQICHKKNVILKSFQNHIMNFDIPLTFACLPQAGTLKFGIPYSRYLCPPFLKFLLPDRIELDKVSHLKKGRRFFIGIK